MVTAAEIVTTLRGLGFFDFLLPWIFTFAVVYGLMMTANIFKNDVLNKKISATVSLVAAFFVTAFAGRELAAFFITLFGSATVILAGILVIILLLTMVGFDHKDDKKGLKRTSVMIVLIIIGIILFIVSTGASAGIGYWGLLSPDMIALIIVLIIIIAAVHIIVSGGSDSPEPDTGGG